MLSPEDYARKLENDLSSIGNGPDALAQLVDALDRFESIENWQPSTKDWEDYEAYLDRLDYRRIEPLGDDPNFKLTSPQRWIAWQARVPLPNDATPSNEV